jgi:hypothetical protein
MTFDDNENLKLLYATTGGLPYRPATYTCITEFTDNFPQKKITEFVSQPHLTKPAYKPEDPYPRIYNKDYKKSILTVLSKSE